MLKVFLELKGPLNYISRNTSNKEYKDISFNSLELFILAQVTKTFKVFAEPSIKLQGQLYITISRGLLYIYYIYNELDNLIEEYRRKKVQNPEFVSFLFFYIFLNYIINNIYRRCIYLVLSRLFKLA